MKNRNPNIDLLRGIAIFAVLLLHHALSYGFRDSVLAEILPKVWLHNLVINGGYGVTMFFTISGFLITSIAFRRYTTLGNINIWHFYRMRAARILPALLLALFLIVMFAFVGMESFQNSSRSKSSLGVAILSVLTFWHNVQMQQQGYFNYALNIYWSLSVEELFYLLFPLVCIAIKSRRYIVGIACVLIVIGPIYRWLHLDNGIDYRYAYLACFDAISFGVLAAILQAYVSRQAMHALRILAMICLPVVFLYGIQNNVVFGFTGISLCTALILMHISTTQTEFWRRITFPLRWMGRLSYELYLFHIIVLGLMRSIVPPSSVSGDQKLLMLLIMVVTSCLISYMVARWYATPLNKWLRSNDSVQ